MSCIRVVVLGNQGVGKSKLIYRIAERKWAKDSFSHCIAIDQRLAKNYLHQGEPICLALFNYDGFEENLIHKIMRDADAFIIAYDLSEDGTNNKSNVERWLKMINTVNDKRVGIVIVGTKADCVDNCEMNIINSNISQNIQEEQLIVSSKTGMGVQDLCDQLIKSTMKHYIPQKRIRLRNTKECEIQQSCF